MAGFSPSTYSLLYKKIKSVATGVKSVNADPTNPNNIIFTLHDNSKITITLSNPIIFANKYSFEETVVRIYSLDFDCFSCAISFAIFEIIMIVIR